MGTHRVYREHKFAFGKQLLALRTRIALTQSELASQLGAHRRSVQKWETGESYPKAEMLQRLIAVFLGHHAFTSGNERVEAQALWDLAVQDGPHALVPFDEAWFARTLAQNDERGTRNDEPDSMSQERTPSSFIAHRSSLIDWGEAIAVPALYSRDREVATLRQWVVEDRCRVITILGLGGMGKSSLAITVAHQVLSQFEVVLFRSLQNGPPLAEVLDRGIRAVSDQHAAPPEQLTDKIALLVQLFRERRCLLILDNFESIMQPGALSGTYRTGYPEYGALLHALTERNHQSCLLLTSREKPSEPGPLEGRSAPVRTLQLGGLDDSACQSILEARDIMATEADVIGLARLYGGNPLALHLVAEPIRELFGGDVGAFLATGDAFFNGVGMLLSEQFARSTPLEQALLYWLAVERQLVPLADLLTDLAEVAPPRELFAALESLRRRMLIEHGSNGPAFTLQPAILEFVTDQLVAAICHELVDGQPWLLHRHVLVQATARDYVRRSQEQLIAIPLLERLTVAAGGADAVERQLLTVLASWRDQPLEEQGYGPGNIINLLRLLRGNLRGLDLARLAIRQAYLQGVELQDTNLAGAWLRDCLFNETFGALTAVALNSTGDYWAAASRRGEIRVWAVGGQTLRQIWQGHADMAWTIAFSPDGRMLASGSWDGTVKLWDVATGKLRWLGRHASYVNGVAFAPDGSTLISGASDATIRFWDVRNGTHLQTLSHPGPVAVVMWSPDGSLIASGDAEGCIRLWDVRMRGPAICVQTLAEHTSWVDGLAFSPDGSKLASASWDGRANLWEVASGRLLGTLAAHSARMNRVAWSPDGRVIARGGLNKTIWLWDVEHSSYRAPLQGHTDAVTGLTFTPDSRSLLSGSEDGTLRVWDVASGQCLRVMQGYAASLYDVDWSPDGTQIVCGGSDAMVTIYAATGTAPPQVLRGHSGLVFGVGWSPDGGRIASGSWDTDLRLWDPTTGDCLRVLRDPSDPDALFCGVAWSPDGQLLASTTQLNHRRVLIWDVIASAYRWVSPAYPAQIRRVAWSPDGRLAGGDDNGEVMVWNIGDGELLFSLGEHQRGVRSVTWSPDGRLLASAGGGSGVGELFVWDAQRGERLRAFAGHPEIVYAAAWGPGTALLVSGGGDGALRWWDVESGQCIRVREAHQGAVQALRRSPDGTTLASCGNDGAIMLWDLQSGKHLRTLRRDRIYERLNIAGLIGITEAQHASLLALGAVEEMGDGQAASRTGDRSTAAEVHPADDVQRAGRDQNEALGLPFQPTSFIGRAAELRTIARLLGDPACRLLTLLGPGGIGKTRLALEVASGQASAFADGVTFVALAAVSTPSQIVAAIGDALGLSFASQLDPIAHLLGYLRERQMLLLLDTFEHLLDGADLVADIIAHAPHLTILVTSRERLDLQTEWLFNVEGLVYPPERLRGSAPPPGLEDPADYSAVELFVQRARQMQPGLSLSASARTTIVSICQQVAGIPLAIELAAAAVRSLPLAEIERQIRANLDVRAATLRDVPARHRSMHVVFDQSWNLLGERERALFSHLAVFRGGWTTAAAAEVAGATSPLLVTLVDKSLVRRDSTATRSTNGHTLPDAMAEPRYAMLEPIREYALDQLVARGEAAALQRAHAKYYLALAEAAVAQWDSPSADAVIAQVDRDYDNLRAVLQWARDGGDRILGLQLAVALRRFWQRRGYYSEGRAWLEDLLALDDAASDHAAMAARQRALHTAAWLASDQHDFARATQLFEQSMALRQALGESEGETQVLLTTARQARAAGQYQQATALFEGALERHRAMGNRESASAGGLGQSLYDLALVRREQGDIADARILLEEGIELHRTIGEREGIAIGLLGLGDIARDQGDAAGVREYTGQSLAIARELSIQWAIGFALNNLALADYFDGNLTGALALAEESLSLFRSLKADGSLAEVLITRGQIVRAQGDATGAYASLREALRLALSFGPRLMVPYALERLADILAGRGQTQLAVQCLAAASALREQMSTPVRPVDQASLTNTSMTARSALGADAFAAVWTEAQTTPLEQILSIILSVDVTAALVATKID